MKEALRRGILGSIPLLGTVVGIGFFRLPYLFGQYGFLATCAMLGVVLVAQIRFLQAYGHLVLRSPRHARFLHVVEDVSTPMVRALAAICYFATLGTALVAYILASGTFLSYLTPSIHAYQGSLIMGLVLGGMLFGGKRVLGKMEHVVMPLFFLLLGSMFFALRNSFDKSALIGVSEHMPKDLPFGALLFSLSGISAIPEVRDGVSGNVRVLSLAIALGMTCAALLYAGFSGGVLMLARGDVPYDAVAMFLREGGTVYAMVGAGMGLAVMMMVYDHVGTALVHTLIYDFGLPVALSRLIIAGIPFALVVVGVEDVLFLLQHAGGFFGAFLGLSVLVAYERARAQKKFPKHIPLRGRGEIFLLASFFLGIFLLTFIG